MTENSNRPQKFHLDRKMVTDQPGFTVMAVGLLLSFFLGMTLKGLLSPSRIKSLVEKAAANIHKDVEVKVESARFSLSDGFWPQARVVVSGVRLESKEECWMSPVITLDELDLPISIRALLRGQVPFTSVEAHDMQLRFRTDKKNCDSVSSKDSISFSGKTITPSVSEKSGSSVAGEVVDKDAKSNPVSGIHASGVAASGSAVPDSTASSSAVQGSPLIRLKRDQTGHNEVESVIERITIDRLQILHQHYAQFPVDLQTVVFEMKSQEPKKLVFKAKTSLLRDPQVNEYLSHANIVVEYNESPEEKVDAHIFGNWREGYYSLRSSLRLHEQDMMTELELRHIPVAKLFPLLRQYELMKTEYNAKEIWLSLKARNEGSLAEISKSAVHISDFRIEGDLGSAEADTVRISSLNPFKVQPFRMQIERFNLDKLLIFLNRQKPPSFLGTLGEISGNLDYFDDNNLRINGIYSGLEFIFANQGHQETQKVEAISGQMNLENGRWNAKVDSVRILDGILEGRLDLEASKDFRDLKLSARLDELTLSPTIEKLMTRDGSLGHFRGQVQSHFLGGVLADIKGQIQTDKAEVQGVLMDSPRFALSSDREGFGVQVNMKGMDLKKSSPAFLVLNDVLQAEDQKQVSLKMLQMQIRSRDLRDLSWKKLSLQWPDRGLKILSDGGWNSDGELSGQIQFAGKKSNRNYRIRGHRDRPLFEMNESKK